MAEKQLDRTAETITTTDLKEVVARVDGWRNESLLTRAEVIASDLVEKRENADHDVRDKALKGIKHYLASFVADVNERGPKRSSDERLVRLITTGG